MRPNYTVTQCPAAEPVTGDQAAAHCRIDSSDDLAYVGDLVAVAREYFDGMTGRSSARMSYLLTAARWEDVFDQTPSARYRETPRDLYLIPLFRSPLISVESIKFYAQGDDELTTMDDADYHVITATEPGAIQLKSEPPALADRADAIQISFTAGGNEAPAMSKHAIKMLVAHFYEQRTPVAFTSVQQIPFTLQAIIDNQRIRGHFA